MPKSVQCKRCVNLRNDWCDKKIDSPDPEILRDCQYYRVATRADRLRSMTDEELADFLWSIGDNPLTGNVYLAGKLIFFSGDGNGWLDWLKQEVDDGE